MKLEFRGDVRVARTVVEKFATWPERYSELDGPFVECTHFQVEAHDEVYHFNEPLRPLEPSREVADGWEVDDDGEEYPVSYRTLSDAEYEEALEAYQRELADWRKALEKHRKTNGTHIVAGPVTIDGTFATASGAYASGSFSTSERKWYWRSWMLAHLRPL